jgi:hypothetical protein
MVPQFGLTTQLHFVLCDAGVSPVAAACIDPPVPSWPQTSGVKGPNRSGLCAVTSPSITKRAVRSRNAAYFMPTRIIAELLPKPHRTPLPFLL